MCMDRAYIDIIKHRQKQMLKGCDYKQKSVAVQLFHPTFQRAACVPTPCTHSTLKAASFTARGRVKFLI